MTSKPIALMWFIIIGLFVASFKAHADINTVMLDYSDDFQSYARIVALLNQEQQDQQIQNNDDKRRTSMTQLVALVCKTDGSEVDFVSLSPYYVIAGPKNCFTLFFPSEEMCRDAASVLEKTEGIVYAEPDCEVYANSSKDNASEDSAHTFHSWGASQMNFGNYMDYVENWGTGSASIAVVDSGVFPHSLIKKKLLSSGYDYVDGDDDSSNDLFGHGTNVAGIIADCTADEPVYIYPIRVLGSTGSGKMSNVVNAVREAKSRGVNIINLSLESTVMSEALDDAILEAVSAGIIVVVAAGNSSCNTSGVCPAHLTNAGVIVVGAAEGNEGVYNRASYSNYGSSVDVYAFGTGIDCCSISGGYSNETGTSMAAPHISALCAMMQLIHPGLSPGQAERRLKKAAIGADSVIVPDSLLMIPYTEGFFLTSVKMSVDDILALPPSAYPETACETITYKSSDEQVAVYEDGYLNATGIGTSTITASCKGFEDAMFVVDVDNQDSEAFVLPEAIECIEDEAFYGVNSIALVTIPDTLQKIGDYVFDNCESLKQISIPESVSIIGENTFSNAVIICHTDSIIYQYAIEHGCQYVTIN